MHKYFTAKVSVELSVHRVKQTSCKTSSKTSSKTAKNKQTIHNKFWLSIVLASWLPWLDLAKFSQYLGGYLFWSLAVIYFIGFFWSGRRLFTFHAQSHLRKQIEICHKAAQNADSYYKSPSLNILGGAKRFEFQR